MADATLYHNNCYLQMYEFYIIKLKLVGKIIHSENKGITKRGQPLYMKLCLEEPCTCCFWCIKLVLRCLVDYFKKRNASDNTFH